MSVMLGGGTDTMKAIYMPCGAAFVNRRQQSTVGLLKAIILAAAHACVGAHVAGWPLEGVRVRPVWLQATGNTRRGARKRPLVSVGSTGSTRPQGQASKLLTTAIASLPSSEQSEGVRGRYGGDTGDLNRRSGGRKG